MKKDVIYIDIEDDITSIIDKIKSGNSKIVALVPPKRIGALQSAVNLKLLQKAAASVDKRVVLITSDQALSALAAGVKIPVAKNLQSRPEIAPIATQEADDNDVIKGEELPVGDLAKTSAVSAAIANEERSSINNAAKAAGGGLASPVTADKAADAKKVKSGAGFKGKVPNFDTFRKKLFILGGLGVLLIGFFVWAILFAPHATVTVKANTNAINIDEPLNLDPNQQTDPQLNRISPVVKQIKKTATAEFDTTGTKEVGKPATGQVNVTNCEYPDGFTIPAGTTFTAQSGHQFTSLEAASLAGFRRASECSNTTKAVAVQAITYGPEYNVPAQSYEISGIDGQVDADGQPMSGGTRENVSIVAAADVEKAKQQLQSQDANSVKAELAKQFTGNVILIQESFKAEPGQPTVSPAVGEQAKRARISAETTYTMVALPRSDVDKVLESILKEEIKDDTTRRIYSTGSKTLKFSRFQPAQGGTYTVQMNTTGYIGPTINEEQLKKNITGRNYGEIEQLINSINGVEDVDIQFSPFWVTRAPSPEKLTVQFTVKNNAQ